MSRARKWTRLGAAGLILLTACGPSNSVVIPLYPARAYSEQAQHSGRLEIHGQCLVIVADESVHTVAWPQPGTVWDAAAGTITLSGVTARIGASVTLGGGEAHVVDLSGDWITPPAPECLTVPVWYASRMDLETRL